MRTRTRQYLYHSDGTTLSERAVRSLTDIGGVGGLEGLGNQLAKSFLADSTKKVWGYHVFGECRTVHGCHVQVASDEGSGGDKPHGLVKKNYERESGS
jgi:hypothetical protein